MIRSFIIFLLSCICTFTLCASSCQKEKPDVLPEETQEGKNTFGCRVDGKIWVPQKGGMYRMKPLSLQYSYSYNYVSIDANRVKENTSILLYISGIKNDTSFEISNRKDSLYTQEIRYMDTSYNHYYPIKQYKGNFNLKKLDLVNGIMAGTFWFDAIDTVSGKIVKIRDGRFDFKI